MIEDHWDWVRDGFKQALKEYKEFISSEYDPIEKKLSELSFADALPILTELRRKAKEKYLWLPQMSIENGGMGLKLAEYGILSEVLGKKLYGHFIFNCQAPDAGNLEILIDHASDEQKELYLKPLLNGDIRSCFSMVEPDTPGSNPTWLNTTAEKDGNGNYVINGHKWFSTGAEGSTVSIVMAVTNPDQPKHKRASMIIVPTDTKGFNLIRNIPVMGHTGSGWLSHGEIKFENCVVPITNRLGPEGEGFRIAQERLGPGRIHHCMRWIGIAERAFEMMVRHTASRQVAPNVTLASQQTIQNWIAESRAEINASRLMVLDVARKIDQEGPYAARIEISLIKFYVANMLQRVVDRSLQTHGGLGMTDDTPLARWYAHERAARIYDGPDEVHKRSVAKQIISEFDGV